MERNVLADAVRQLRERFGESQMEFAKRMGWHIVTLARYETKRAPKGKALAALEQVAREHGHQELMDTFRAALAEELGTSYALRPGPNSIQVPEGQEVAFMAFLDALGQPQDPDTRKILKLLKPRMEKWQATQNVLKQIEHDRGEPGSVRTTKLSLRRRGTDDEG